jgi:hypothetical protein
MRIILLLNALAAAAFVSIGSYQFAMGHKEDAKVYFTIGLIATVVTLIRVFLISRKQRL